MTQEYQYNGVTFLLEEDRSQQRIKVTYAIHPERQGYVGVNNADKNDRVPFGYMIPASPNGQLVGPGLPEVNGSGNSPTEMLQQCCQRLINIQTDLEEGELDEIGRYYYDPKKWGCVLENWYVQLRK